MQSFSFVMRSVLPPMRPFLRADFNAAFVFSTMLSLWNWSKEAFIWKNSLPSGVDVSIFLVITFRLILCSSKPLTVLIIWVSERARRDNFHKTSVSCHLHAYNRVLPLVVFVFCWHQISSRWISFCNRLIKNAVICWGCLYLSQKLEEMNSPEQKDKLLSAMSSHSPMLWAHTNRLGEYDFSDEKLKDTAGIRLPKIAA